MFLSECAIPIFDEDEPSCARKFRPIGVPCDWLSGPGVRLWHPERQYWTEVSVLGNIYECRSSSNIPGRRLKHLKNDLVDGSIIEVAGLYVMYQSADRIISASLSSKHFSWIERVNSNKPLCPVLLRPIRLDKLSPRDVAMHLFQKTNRCGAVADHQLALGRRSLSMSDHDDMASDAIDGIPFVFTACGHVHSFSKELSGK